jgi:adenylosuccinate synthase
MANGMAYVVVDLGYGDAGKGTIVDALVRKVNAKLVVRFNGGCQAAHNVVLADGTHHTFSQFGSGSFVPGVKTYLSEYFLWNPISMMTEAEVLQSKGLTDILDRVYVDERALVVTPWHRAFNRLLEFTRGNGRHGSCGEGIGQAVELRYSRPRNYSLLAGELRQLSVEDIADVLTRTAQLKRDEWFAMSPHPEVTDEFPHEDLRFLLDVEAPLKCATLYKQIAARVKFAGSDVEWDSQEIGTMYNDNIVFEGAQGILIDENWGFAPYQTWSDCTSANARNILRRVGWIGGKHVIGVSRSYAIRHGAGPFPTEECFGRLPGREAHNVWNPWQGPPRFGKYDAVATNYAIEADGHIDSLAITHLDRFNGDDEPWGICTRYDWPESIGFGPLVFTPKWKQLHEAEITSLMWKVKAMTGVYDRGALSMLEAISDLHALPISIYSRGPTYANKTFPTEILRP